jgi:hypothetical protein
LQVGQVGELNHTRSVCSLGHVAPHNAVTVPRHQLLVAFV